MWGSQGIGVLVVVVDVTVVVVLVVAAAGVVDLVMVALAAVGSIVVRADMLCWVGARHAHTACCCLRGAFSRRTAPIT